MTTETFAVTKTQAAYVAIRQAIETGEFPPGSRLLVSALQQRLGISPTPIREALRMLQSDGLATSQAHLGMTVTSYAQADIEEVYRIREMLEPLAASFAAEHRTPESLERLETVHEDLARAVRDGRNTAAAELNGEWHFLITEMSGLRLVAEFTMRLRAVLPIKAMWQTSTGELSVLEHAQINSAIVESDSDKACAVMGAHVARGRRQAIRRFAERLTQ